MKRVYRAQCTPSFVPEHLIMIPAIVLVTVRGERDRRSGGRDSATLRRPIHCLSMSMATVSVVPSLRCQAPPSAQVTTPRRVLTETDLTDWLWPNATPLSRLLLVPVARHFRRLCLRNCTPRGEESSPTRPHHHGRPKLSGSNPFAQTCVSFSAPRRIRTFTERSLKPLPLASWARGA